jgi:hypothetical protein
MALEKTVSAGKADFCEEPTENGMKMHEIVYRLFT